MCMAHTCPHTYTARPSVVSHHCVLLPKHIQCDSQENDLPIVKSQTGKIYQTKLCTVFSLYLIFKFKFLKFSHLFGMLFTSHVVKLITHQAEIHVSWKLILHLVYIYICIFQCMCKYIIYMYQKTYIEWGSSHFAYISFRLQSLPSPLFQYSWL